MNFRYDDHKERPEGKRGDPCIVPVAGYETNIDHVLEYRGGSAIFLRRRAHDGRGSFRFDISITEFEDYATLNCLSSTDRVRGLNSEHRKRLARILGVKVQDLNDIAILEVQNNVARPQR